MRWLILFVAGCFEISWATTMKLSDGLTHFWMSAATLILYLASLLFLGIAMKQLPLGTTYAVWTGIGIIGTFIIGILLFKETVKPAQIICVLLILTGIVGLRLLAD